MPLHIYVMNDCLLWTGPKYSSDSSTPLEFQVSVSGDDYLDLNQCYLYRKCHVQKADEMAIKFTRAANAGVGAEAMVVPVSGLFQSLFSPVDLMMNDVLVATSGDTNPYRAYLTTLLSYSSAGKCSLLAHLEGWAITSPASMTTKRMRNWSGGGRWSPIGAPSTSGDAYNWTCCCRTGWCPETWTWDWCYRMPGRGFHLIDYDDKPQ